MGHGAEVAGEIVPVVELGEGVHQGGLVLKVDVQGGDPQGHRDPDEGDAVEEELQEAPQKDGSQKDHHREEEALAHLPPQADDHDGPGDEIPVGHQIGHQHQRGAAVEILRGDGEKDVEKQVGRRHQRHDQIGDGHQGIEAAQPLHLPEEFIIHIHRPEEGEETVADKEESVEQPDQEVGPLEEQAIQTKGGDLHQAQAQGEQTHGIEEFLIQKNAADVLSVAEDEHQHQRRAKSVGNEDRRKVGHEQCPLKSTTSEYWNAHAGGNHAGSGLSRVPL